MEIKKCLLCSGPVFTITDINLAIVLEKVHKIEGFGLLPGLRGLGSHSGLPVRGVGLGDAAHLHRLARRLVGKGSLRVAVFFEMKHFFGEEEEKR